MQKQVLVAVVNSITTFRSLNEVGEVTKTVNIPSILASNVIGEFHSFPVRMLPTQGIDLSSSLSLQMLSKVDGQTSVGDFADCIGKLATNCNNCYTEKGIGKSLYLASLNDIPSGKSVKDEPIPIIHITAFPNGNQTGMLVHTGDITIRATDIKVHLKAESSDIREIIKFIKKGKLFKIM